MFAPRLRAARDRGLDALLARVLPSGALGPDLDDPLAFHQLPLLLAATGHAAAARRVLQRASRWVTDEGDVRLTASHRSFDPGANDSSSKLHAPLLLGALRAGDAALVTRLDAWFERLRRVRVQGGSGELHPRAGDGATDLASTLRVASVDLALARAADVTAAAGWITALWSQQPHRDALLLRRDAAGQLVSLWPASGHGLHAIHALAPGSGHALVGDALAWCAHARPLTQGPLHERMTRTLCELFDFAVRAERHVHRVEDQAALAVGAAAFARALRSTVPDTALDAADLAVRLALRVCESWQPVGGFGVASEGELAAVGFDREVGVVHALHETLALLDEVEPLRASREAPAGWRVVLCNVPEVKAQEISDAVVSARLAACVNAINPVRSTYEWKGQVERDSEVTLLIKTTADRVPALTARIRAMHPYDLPEVIALAVESGEGHLPYLDWVRSQVTPVSEPPRMPPAS